MTDESDGAMARIQAAARAASTQGWKVRVREHDGQRCVVLEIVSRDENAGLALAAHLKQFCEANGIPPAFLVVRTTPAEFGSSGG